jgi:hypothetical protein
MTGSLVAKPAIRWGLLLFVGSTRRREAIFKPGTTAREAWVSSRLHGGSKPSVAFKPIGRIAPSTDRHFPPIYLSLLPSGAR